MKTRFNYWAFALVALALFTLSGFAQEATNAVAEVGAAVVSEAPKLSVMQMLIPILTPLLIAGIKWGIPRIPSKWLPVIAPVLGMAVDLIAHFATGAASNPALAAGLGLAGVGVREAFDQVKKNQAPKG